MHLLPEEKERSRKNCSRRFPLQASSRDQEYGKSHILRDVELGVNFLGNSLDLGGEIGLDLVDVVTVIVGDEIDGKTQVTETAGSTDAMKVSLRVLGEVEVDHNVDGLNVDTSSDEIGADQVSAIALAEVVEDAVTVSLLHTGVDVVARVSELGNLLRQKLDTVDAIAENNRLVDLKLVEQGVQAVDLLTLVDEGVVLSDSLKGELLHKIDLEGATHEPVSKILDSDWECRREKKALAVGGKVRINLLHD